MQNSFESSPCNNTLIECECGTQFRTSSNTYREEVYTDNGDWNGELHSCPNCKLEWHIEE